MISDFVGLRTAEQSDFMTIIKDEKNKRVIVKANALLEGRYVSKGKDAGCGMGVMAHKIFRALLAKINPTEDELPRTVLDRKDLVGLDVGVGKQTIYRNFSKECSELLKLMIVITERDLKTGRVRDREINVFSEATKVWRDDKRDYLEEAEFVFTKQIQPFLKNLGKEMPYTKYWHQYAKELSTITAIRLYELSRRWRNIKEKKPVISKIISLIDLKEILLIDQNKYNNFSNLDKLVLKPAIKQINEKTDIRLVMEGVKGNFGKKIISIKLKIYNNIMVEDEEDVSGMVIPERLDENIANTLLDLFPKELGRDKTGNTLTMDFDTYGDAILKESINDYCINMAKDKMKIKTTKYAYFKGICSKKLKEYEAFKESSDTKGGNCNNIKDTSWQEEGDYFDEVERELNNV